MKIINTEIPKDKPSKQFTFIKRRKILSQSTIFSIIAVILLFAVVYLIFVLRQDSKSANYNTGQINEENITPVPTVEVTSTVVPRTEATGTETVATTKPAITTPVPTVIPFGQIKGLIDKTKDETTWVSPSLASFNWIESCSDQTKQTSKINGSITQTSIDFTKSSASKTEQDIQAFFQTLDWKEDTCNSSNTSTKQIRAFKNKSTDKKVLVTYDSQYIDAPDTNYPPSGKKFLEIVTVQYE